MYSLTRLTFLSICIFVAGCSEPVMISPDAVLPDGSVYEGDIKDGKFHGRGRLLYPHGDEYQGEYQDGLMHGQGVYTYANGSRYEGEFVAGRFQGKGKYERQEGGVYEGEFKNNEYHGQGKYTNGDQFYQGSFKEGVLSGKGSYSDYQGRVYEGEVDEWTANGTGKFTDEDGNVLSGKFVNGAVDGIAEMHWSDGSHYKGGFDYGRPDGDGVKTNADGSVYEGEFSYGQYHGTGTLTKPANADRGEEVLTGKWRQGVLVYNSVTGKNSDSQSELALEFHQDLLEKKLQALETGTDGVVDVYFLGVAGDGTQSVFRRELEYVTDIVEQRYQSPGKSLALINHHDSAELYPMATTRSIRSAINAIGDKMNSEEDVLFAYLSSHGSREFDFSLNHDTIRLPDLSAQSLAKMLQESDIKWKVIIVSACYSGGFIPLLQDDYTMVITAADSKSRSFGCSEESEMTYFGKAFFKEVLARDLSVPLTEAFARAKQIVGKWEKDEELNSSNPLISAPPAIVNKLDKIQRPDVTGNTVQSAKQ